MVKCRPLTSWSSKKFIRIISVKSGRAFLLGLEGYKKLYKILLAK